MIDAHQHFWKYNALRDAWITDDMNVLRHHFMPEDLAPLLVENNIDGCVAVQADQSEEETMFLMDLASRYDFIKGIVGWIDLRAEDISEKLKAYSLSRKVKGFRHIVQAEANGFLHDNRFLRGIKALHAYNFTYDILIRDTQLPEAEEFVKALPEQRFVLDHLCKPCVRKKEFHTWSKDIGRMAHYKNVYCKFSGLITEADWYHWKPADLTPYLDWVMKCFGANRVMYGSDWPVCLLGASYNDQLLVIQEYISSFSVSERKMIMGDNAIQFYNL